MNTQKKGMTGKDIITVGIFSAIYFVINFAFMLLSGLHPLLWILMPSLIAIFAGIPFLMMCTKVPKTGAVVLMGFITALIYFVTGQFTVVILIAFEMCIRDRSMSIVGPLIAAMGFVDNLAKVGTIVGSVDEILLKPEQDHGTQPAQLGKPDIALDHVSFGYAQDKEILHNISLTIPAGSLTALVGPSGSGKSTIAKLIAGFWDVTKGRITLGGVEESRIPLEQLYDQVAFVSQDNYLLSLIHI